MDVSFTLSGSQTNEVLLRLSSSALCASSPLFPLLWYFLSVAMEYLLFIQWVIIIYLLWTRTTLQQPPTVPAEDSTSSVPPLSQQPSRIRPVYLDELQSQGLQWVVPDAVHIAKYGKVGHADRECGHISSSTIVNPLRLCSHCCTSLNNMELICETQ